MAQQRRPDDPQPVTQADIPSNLKKGAEVPDALDSENKDVLVVRSLIDRHEIQRLQDYLKTQAGEVATVSSQMRASAEAKVGKISKMRSVWSFEEIQQTIERFVNGGAFLDALKFIDMNEQLIVESWVNDMLENQKYDMAYAFLDDYAKTHPSSHPNKHDMDLQLSIDAEILNVLGPAEMLETMAETLNNDRVWRTIHVGDYQTAAKLCRQLSREKNRTHRKTQKAETQPEVEKRHEAELLRALPHDLENLKKIYPNIHELMTHYQRLSTVHALNQSSIELLQGQCQLIVDKLFEQRKIRVQEQGLINAGDDFLSLVNDLKLINLNLYINPDDESNELYLLAPHEVFSGYKRVDVMKLRPDDVVFDYVNFEQHGDQPPKAEVAFTAEKNQPSYIWKTKIVKIKPERAAELKRAA